MATYVYMYLYYKYIYIHMYSVLILEARLILLPASCANAFLKPQPNSARGTQDHLNIRILQIVFAGIHLWTFEPIMAPYV